MITRNFVYIIITLMGYFVTFTVMPACCLQSYVKDRGLGYRLCFYNITGILYISLCSYALAFLHIYCTLNLWVVYYILPVLIRHIISREKVKENLLNLKSWYVNRIPYISSRQKRLKTVKDIVSRFCHYFYKKYLNGRLLQYAALLAMLAFIVYFFGYFKTHYYTYAFTDEETHLYWISSLMNNNPFPAGLYPHGAHFISAAISSLFQLDETRIWFSFNVLAVVLEFLFGYLTIRSFFRAKGAAIFSVGFVIITNMISNNCYYRLHQSLPMEIGMMAFFIMLYGLVDYIKTSDKRSLLLFGFGFAGTIDIHFYVAIFSVFSLVAFGIVYIIPAMKKKLVARILVCAMISGIASMIPYAAGYAFGYQFERSIDWALAVIENDDRDTLYNTDDEVNTDSDIEPVEEDSETDEIQTVPAAMEESSTERIEDMVFDLTCNFTSDTDDQNVLYLVDNNTDTKTEVESVEEDSETEVIQIFATGKNETLNERLAGIVYDLTGKFTSSAFWAVLFLGLIGFAFAYSFVGLILCMARKKQADKFLVCLAIVVTEVIDLVFFILAAEGKFTIMNTTRIGTFMGISLVLLVAIPVQFFCDVLTKVLRREKFADEIIAVLATAGLLYCYMSGNVKQLSEQFYYFDCQDADMKLCQELVHSHENNSWTVISPVNDLQVIRYYGYHYEVRDILANIEKNEDIYIPTKDIYVVVENAIFNYGYGERRMMDGSDYFEKSLPVSAELALKSLDELGFYNVRALDRVYYDIRQGTMSKLYYWMEKVKQIYPDDVSLYYSDGKCSVYHISQDVYFLLNLNVDYTDLAMADYAKTQQNAF